MYFDLVFIKSLHYSFAGLCSSLCIMLLCDWVMAFCFSIASVQFIISYLPFLLLVHFPHLISLRSHAVFKELECFFAPDEESLVFSKDFAHLLKKYGIFKKLFFKLKKVMVNLKGLYRSYLLHWRV